MFDNLFWSISWEQAVCARGKTTQWRPARRCTPVSTCAQKIYFFTFVKENANEGLNGQSSCISSSILTNQSGRLFIHADKISQYLTNPISSMWNIFLLNTTLMLERLKIGKKLIFVYLLLYIDGMAALAGKWVEIQTESIELPRLSKCWSWLITMALYFAVHRNILHCCPFVQRPCVLLYSSMVYPNIPPLTSIHALYNALSSVQQQYITFQCPLPPLEVLVGVIRGAQWRPGALLSIWEEGRWPAWYLICSTLNTWSVILDTHPSILGAQYSNYFLNLVVRQLDTLYAILDIRVERRS